MDLLAEWQAELPETSVDHPDVWVVRGVWAEHLKRPMVASRCYRTAVILDAGFQKAIYRLSVIEGGVASAEVRQGLQDRVRLLKQYKAVCKSIFFKGLESQLVAAAIDLAESLERFHEAVGWCKVATLGGRSTVAEQERLRHLQSKVAAHASIDRSGRWKLLDRLEISNSKFPEWPLPQASAPSDRAAALVAHFSSDAINRRLDFQYENGADVQSGLMIRQSMGGGVAVIDFDHDSRSDIFIPQGQSPGVSVTDALFRNLSGDFFRELICRPAAAAMTTRTEPRWVMSTTMDFLICTWQTAAQIGCT